MSAIAKLESKIGDVLLFIEENERIDRITKEKLSELISNLYTTTGEIKEKHDEIFDKLNAIQDLL